ncbi:MAG: hypothetical protein JRH01_15015 [Deltaproteobacteria bacterium]|nr:hypothetical protein [Deltaproteobacteria bacterium]MBW2394006.1 hypothetical protein [Deltaproteobacteria bacterium]
MRRIHSSIFVLALAALMVSQADAQDRSDKNQMVRVDYGTVVGIEPDSNPGLGARLAMLVGLAVPTGYIVRLGSGRDVRVIADPGEIRQGDCVAIEQGRSANIRRVSSAYCQAKGGAPVAGRYQDSDICDQAMLDFEIATDDAEIALAARKLRFLCAN